MADGIINLYKPAGYTSHDCVAIVRRVAKIKKVGHAGTLDPMAEGVLPICVGTATRIIQYFDADLKTYECVFKLGIATDTLDAWGKVLEDKTQLARNMIETGEICEKKIRREISKFIGIQRQIPPKYSALKLNGKKLYEYARAGEEIDLEIKARDIFIEDMKLREFDERNLTVSFSVKCSKGTYVRTICANIGEKLGICATMTALERSATGAFCAQNSVTMDELKAMQDAQNSEELLAKKMIAMDETLENLGKLIVKEEKKHFFLNGVRLFTSDVAIQSEPRYKCEKPHHSIPDYFSRAYKVYAKSEEFLGVAFYDQKSNTYKADKILTKE